MKLHPVIRKGIVPLVWIVVSLLVSFILARYISPLVETEKKLFGLKTVHHYSFNPRLFFLALGISLGVLTAGILVRQVPSVKRFTDWLARTIFSSLWFVLALTLTSGVFYVLGLTKPLFISEQFFFVEKEISLLNSIRMMFENDEFFLGTIIFTFTLVFPISKYVLLLISLVFSQKEQIHQLNRALSVISKWSMLDVYIVALLLLNMKFDSRIVNMELQSGVVWFTLSILLIMLAMAMRSGTNAVRSSGTLSGT